MQELKCQKHKRTNRYQRYSRCCLQIKDLLMKPKNNFKFCEANKIEGCISAIFVPNMIYILRMELHVEKTMTFSKSYCWYLILQIWKQMNLKKQQLLRSMVMKMHYKTFVQVISRQNYNCKKYQWFYKQQSRNTIKSLYLLAQGINSSSHRINRVLGLCLFSYV